MKVWRDGSNPNEQTAHEIIHKNTEGEGRTHYKASTDINCFNVRSLESIELNCPL